MRVFRGFDNASVIEKPVVTVGSFDGVHCGHNEILKLLVETAKSIDGESVVITFEPHPRMVIEKNSEVMLITDLTEKTALLGDAGIDNLIIADFTQEFSNLGYRDFIEKYLVDKLHVHTLLVGYNHHFGHNKEGNAANLNDIARELGFCIQEMPRRTVDGDKVSSTVVRTLLQKGNMRNVAKYLGHSYVIMGGLGVNGSLDGIHGQKLLPRAGEYPVKVIGPESSTPAIAHILEDRTVKIIARGRKLPIGNVTVKFV